MSRFRRHEHRSYLDIFGIGLSLLCVIHCVATPFIILLAPTIGAYLESELVHQIALVFVLFMAMPTFIRGYKQHRNIISLVLGSVGISFLFMALLLSEVSEEFETILTVIGSILTVSAHFYNIRSGHACSSLKHHPHVVPMDSYQSQKKATTKNTNKASQAEQQNQNTAL